MLNPEDFAARPLSEAEARQARRELYRYLGCGSTAPDDAVRAAAEEALGTLIAESVPRQVHRVFPLGWDRGAPVLEGLRIDSRDLARALSGCDSVCLMAATLGPATDRQVARETAAGRMSRAVILQAAGTALIEIWCDRVSEAVRQAAAAEGRFPRPRFSPGYGDLALSLQEALFRILNISKTIGVTLTGSLLMLPSKSVTALIGLSPTDARCAPQGCALCGRAADCAYRRA